MAMGAVLAAALTNHAARTRALYIDGLDVLRYPGGQSYGVLLDTLHVTEAGPGNISALTALIDDPQSVLTFSEKAVVRFMDLVNDVPIFLGFLLVAEPHREGLARTIEIRAVGIEAMLDWLVLPVPFATTVTSFSMGDNVQSLYAQCVGVGYSLRVFQDILSTTSTQAEPLNGVGFSDVISVPAGSTLRRALEFVVGGMAATAPAGESISFTVDFYAGLRSLVIEAGPVLQVTDWATTTVSTAGPAYPVDTAHVLDSSSTSHQVLVSDGTNYTVVSDGTGIIGPVAVVTESTLTTAADRISYGKQWLAAHTSSVRGSVGSDGTLTVGAAGSEHHAGGLLTITDATMGLAAYTVVLLQIDKDFRATDEVWQITYGNPAPSGAKLIRQLTRSVVN